MTAAERGRYVVRYLGAASGWFVFARTERRAVDAGAPVWLEAAGPFLFRADAIAEAERLRVSELAGRGGFSVRAAS